MSLLETASFAIATVLPIANYTIRGYYEMFELAKTYLHCYTCVPYYLFHSVFLPFHEGKSSCSHSYD